MKKPNEIGAGRIAGHKARGTARTQSDSSKCDSRFNACTEANAAAAIGNFAASSELDRQFVTSTVSWLFTALGLRIASATHLYQLAGDSIEGSKNKK
jgi:hypothetical protein